MKRILGLTLTTLFLVAVAQAHEGHQHEKGKQATPVKLTGEVLDLYCYLQHPDGATGVGHAKCAKSCIDKGLPIGFLAANGTVYVILGKDHEPVGAMVSDWVGKRSTISGSVVEYHGVKGFELATIGPAGVVEYTCSMHPEVRQNEPGKCPKCGMELIQAEGKSPEPTGKQ